MSEPGTVDAPAFDERFRISEIEFDESAAIARSADAEHERKIAIYDLLEENYFRLEGSEAGPYKLILGLEDNRLVFGVHLADGQEHGKVMLSMSPFRRIVRDYFLVCESYYDAIRSATTQQIEALDMGGAAFTTKAPRC